MLVQHVQWCCDSITPSTPVVQLVLYDSKLDLHFNVCPTCSPYSFEWHQHLLGLFVFLRDSELNLSSFKINHHLLVLLRDSELDLFSNDQLFLDLCRRLGKYAHWCYWLTITFFFNKFRVNEFYSISCDEICSVAENELTIYLRILTPSPWIS